LHDSTVQVNVQVQMKFNIFSIQQKQQQQRRLAYLGFGASNCSFSASFTAHKLKDTQQTDCRRTQNHACTILVSVQVMKFSIQSAMCACCLFRFRRINVDISTALMIKTICSCDFAIYFKIKSQTRARI